MFEARLPDGRTGIDAMLEAFDAALSVLPSAHRVGVVEFHDRNVEPSVLSPLTTDRASIRSSVARFANSGFDHGSSRVWDGVARGTSLFSSVGANPRAVRALVFLSDGRDTSSLNARDSLAGIAADRRVQLYAMGVGEVFQANDLRSLAYTDGRHVLRGPKRRAPTDTAPAAGQRPARPVPAHIHHAQADRRVSRPGAAASPWPDDRRRGRTVRRGNLLRSRQPGRRCRTDPPTFNRASSTANGLRAERCTCPAT